MGLAAGQRRPEPLEARTEDGRLHLSRRVVAGVEATWEQGAPPPNNVVLRILGDFIYIWDEIMMYCVDFIA